MYVGYELTDVLPLGSPKIAWIIRIIMTLDNNI